MFDRCWRYYLFVCFLGSLAGIGFGVVQDNMGMVSMAVFASIGWLGCFVENITKEDEVK